MGEVTGLASIAVDHWHFPPAHLLEELADHIGVLLLGLLAGTVDGEEPHAHRWDGIKLMVKLGQPLHALEGAPSPAVSPLPYACNYHSTASLKVGRNGRHP